MIRGKKGILSLKCAVPQDVRTYYRIQRATFFENSYVFIHVGKCGGTSIASNIGQHAYLTEIHMAKPLYVPRARYLLAVRNPISRFVSAFWHHKREAKKEKFNNTKISKIVQNFESVEHFIVDGLQSNSVLSSDSVKFSCGYGHIGMGLAFYLDPFLWKVGERNISNVFCQEFLDEDLHQFLGFPSMESRRVSGMGLLGAELQPKSRTFLWGLLQRDYNCISRLYDMGFISKDRYEIMIE